MRQPRSLQNRGCPDLALYIHQGFSLCSGFFMILNYVTVYAKVPKLANIFEREEEQECPVSNASGKR